MAQHSGDTAACMRAPAELPRCTAQGSPTAAVCRQESKPAGTAVALDQQRSRTSGCCSARVCSLRYPCTDLIVGKSIRCAAVGSGEAAAHPRQDVAGWQAVFEGQSLLHRRDDGGAIVLAGPHGESRCLHRSQQRLDVVRQHSGSRGVAQAGRRSTSNLRLQSRHLQPPLTWHALGLHSLVIQRQCNC